MNTLKLTKKIRGLKEENENLRQTNETLRFGLDSTTEKFSSPISKASSLVEELIRVRDAVDGSKTANDILESRYDEEIGPSLIQEILTSEETISSPLKRRIAHEIFVGDTGRDILKGLRDGRSLNDAIVDAGVPIQVGKRRVSLLKEIGYLNSRLNLTDWGSEALEL